MTGLERRLLAGSVDDLAESLKESAGFVHISSGRLYPCGNRICLRVARDQSVRWRLVNRKRAHSLRPERSGIERADGEGRKLALQGFELSLHGLARRPQ